MFASRTVCGVPIPSSVVYIVCILLIVAYGYFLRATGTPDILAQRIFHHPICQDIDGWSGTHFLFFGLLGVLYPNRHLRFLTVGVLWEVIETVLGQNKLEVSGRRLQLIGDQDEEGNSTGADDAYWYGKESDIIVDIAGYSLGSAWASKYWPETVTTTVFTCTATLSPGIAATRPPSWL